MNKQHVFTKDRTLAIKGFAICAMLFHHCFFNTSKFNSFSVSFWPFSEDVIVNIALFGKLCVGTFAFLSGYGLAYKWQSCKPDEKKNYFINRYFGTMSGYWFIFIIMCCFYQIMDGQTLKVYGSGTPTENVINFLMSVLGISHVLGTPMLDLIWWYMGAAIVFIPLVPLFYEAVCKFGVAAVIALTVFLPRALNVAFLGGMHPLSFVMPVLLGVIFEKEKLFEKIHCKLDSDRWWYKFGKILVAVLSVIVAYKLYRRLPFEQYWEIKYGFVPLIVIVCLNETVLDIGWFRKILIFLGKHSMNMYLTHLVFLSYTREFVYNNKHFIVSWGILMLLSISTSIALEWLKKLIQWNKLTTGILHKVSHKG